MAPQTNNQQTKASTRTAYQFACTDEDGKFSACGYLIRNHDLEQLVGFSLQHVKDSHDLDVPASYFENAATSVVF